MIIRKFGCAAVCLAASALLATPVLGDTIGGGAVHTNDTGLNLRAQPSTSAVILTSLPNETFLLIEGAENGWYQVSYNGVRGYVSADYVDFLPAMDGNYSFYATTAWNDVDLCVAPDAGMGVLRSYAAPGGAVQIIGVSGNWLHVRDDLGVEGYMLSGAVNYANGLPSADAFGAAAGMEAPGPVPEASAPGFPAPPPPPMGTPSFSGDLPAGELISNSAKSFIGCAYAYGGSSPLTGFDCSGFASYIYGLYGMNLNRIAQDMYQNDGVAVSFDALAPGDLLFFGSSAYNIWHVGIYVGDHQMVHSSTPGKGVVLADLTGNGYPMHTYVGAKRVLPLP